MSKKVIILLLTAIFLISFVNAQADWRQYGHSFATMHNSQLQGFYGIFNATNVNVTSTTASYSPNIATGNGYVQPLISSLSYVITDTVYKQFIIIADTGYLKIYDKNLLFYDEISTGGNVTGQISISDFDLNGLQDNVVGIFNNTWFKAYYFNTTSNKYSLLNSTDLNSTYNFAHVYGIRSSGQNSYLMGDNSSGAMFIIKVTSSDGKDIVVTSASLPNAFNTTSEALFSNPAEPLAFSDVDVSFLYYSGARVISFDINGNILFSKVITGGESVNGAYFIKSDSTNQRRIFISTKRTSGNNHYEKVSLYRIDGSTLWSYDLFNYATSTFVALDCKSAISEDYDFDLDIGGSVIDNEIYLFCQGSASAIGGTSTEFYYIIKGNDGTVLANYNNSMITNPSQVNSISLTLADMDNNGVDDFISSIREGSSASSKLYVRTPTSLIYDYTFGTEEVPSCVPADLDFDGKLDIICSTKTKLFYFFVGGVPNTKPIINSVTYSPSTTISVGETLSEIISATDNESDAIVYSVKCSDSDSWKSDTTSSTQTCVYATAGNYNNTVRVRDIYHSTYNYLSYNILVTETAGTTCNNNDVCEASIGETTSSCPTDCPSTEETVTVIGGTEIPTKLVDINDEEAGLFPMVYQGTLKFFSAVIIPLFWIVFAIMVTMTILAVFGILKKLANKIG
jgi:hypothetical protein